MRTLRHTMVLTLGLTCLGASVPAYADLSQFARITGDTCFSCHGPEGKGVQGGTIPPIAGKDAGYLAQALKDFKSGKRPSTIMQRHAKGYTDAEIDALAQYLSQIK